MSGPNNKAATFRIDLEIKESGDLCLVCAEHPKLRMLITAAEAEADDILLDRLNLFRSQCETAILENRFDEPLPSYDVH